MKKFLCLFAALTMIFSVCAFADGENKDVPEQTEKVADFPVNAGNAHITEKPLRVAAISPAMTDLIRELGFEKRIVATGEGSSAPIICDEYEDYTIYNIGTVWTPDLAELKKSEADVIFTHTDFTDDLTREIQQMGINVVTIPTAENLDEVFENYRTVYKVLMGNNMGEKMAEKKISRFKEILQKVSDVSKENIEDESAVYMRFFPLGLAGGDSFENAILNEYFNFQNSAEEYINWAYPKEKTEELNPDYIFYYKGAHDSINPEDIEASDIYKSSSAVENKRIYGVNGDRFERRSPKMFSELISIVYDLFPESVPEDLAEF